jgi:hypothetical protein
MSGSILNTAGRDTFRLGYEISPIIFTGGVAVSLLGGMIPIVAFTESLNIVNGLLSGALSSNNGPAGSSLTLDNFFAHFMPLSGGTLINNQVGEFPFANQSVAANAIIVQPNTISMLMICPVRASGGYTTKLATIMALQAAMANHVNQGGLFTVVTPGYIYTSCILTSFRDVSDGQSKQRMSAFQFDFVQPLVTQDDANSAQNSLISKLTLGTPTDGSTSGLGSISSIIPGLSSNIVKSASNLVGSAVGGIGSAVGSVGSAIGSIF